MIREVYELAKDKLIDEPFSEYNKKRSEFLSSTALKTFITESPCDYKYQLDNPEGDKLVYLQGRAFHCYFLEGVIAMDRDFVIGGPKDRNGKEYGFKSKEFKKESAKALKETGKQLITFDIFNLVKDMTKAAMKNPDVAKVMEEGVCERTARAEYCGVPSQIRVDWLNPATLLADLKSCADLKQFKRDVFYKFGYLYSSSFYQSVFKEYLGVTDYDFVPFSFIAVEKKKPHKSAVFEVSRERLEEHRKKNEDALYELKQCKKNDVWPTGFEGLQTLE